MSTLLPRACAGGGHVYLFPRRLWPCGRLWRMPCHATRKPGQARRTPAPRAIAALGRVWGAPPWCSDRNGAHCALMLHFSLVSGIIYDILTSCCFCVSYGSHRNCGATSIAVARTLVRQSHVMLRGGLWVRDRGFLNQLFPTSRPAAALCGA